MAKARSTRRQSGRSVGSTELIIVIPAGSYAHYLEGKCGRNIRPASATASVPQLRPIIVVDVFVPVAIRPVPLGVAIIFRRALKLILGINEARRRLMHAETALAAEELPVLTTNH